MRLDGLKSLISGSFKGAHKPTFVCTWRKGKTQQEEMASIRYFLIFKKLKKVFDLIVGLCAPLKETEIKDFNPSSLIPIS